jgi:hypothetical protein
MLRTPGTALVSRGGQFEAGVNDRKQSFGRTIRGKLDFITRSAKGKLVVDLPKQADQAPTCLEEGRGFLFETDDAPATPRYPNGDNNRGPDHGPES